MNGSISINDVIIKTALDQDVLDILELLYELGRPRPQHEDFESIVRKYIADADKEILVVLYQDKIIAMASIIYLPRLNYTTLELYIPELIISGNYQSKGIGRKLVSVIIGMAKKRNCHRIRLESGNNRQGAHLFYKDLRFTSNAASFVYDLKKF